MLPKFCCLIGRSALILRPMTSYNLTGFPPRSFWSKVSNLFAWGAALHFFLTHRAVYKLILRVPVPVSTSYESMVGQIETFGWSEFEQSWLRWRSFWNNVILKTACIHKKLYSNVLNMFLSKSVYGGRHRIF